MLARGLYAEANKIMAVSKRDYVPIDRGPLRASGTVFAPVKMGATGVSVTLGYGGAARAYAVVQHEDTSLSHPPKNPRPRTGTHWSGRPGQAKYLERAVNERKELMFQNLAAYTGTIFARSGI